MEIKKLFLAVLFSYLSLSIFGQVSFGQPEKINEGWKFTLNDVKDGQNTSLDDKRWKSVDLPHDWSVKGQLSPTLASATGYLPGGIGWYRKTLDIPKDKQGEKVYLYFEGVYNRSEVFINGQLLGKRPNGYISFMYDVTPYIKYGQENVIAVRVDHSQSADSRWYTGSGIYRNVWLVYANPIHIAQWGVYVYPKSVTKKQAILSVEVEIDNSDVKATDLLITNELLFDGKVIAKDSRKLQMAAQNNKIETELKVNNPQIWDLNNPNLYQLKTTVSNKGKVIDQTITTTGIRNYTFDVNKGFALNGEWMKVKGVCIHHDAGVLGAAVPHDVWKRRLQTLKSIGVNAVRTSHNPQAPDLYALCDELGILVLNEAYDEWEFPKRKWLEGWNVGTPGYQGSFDFFEEWGEKDLADLVRRDRNHISIFAWSIGNEVDYPNDPYSHPVLDGGNNTGFTQAQFGGYKKDAPDAMRLGDIAKRLVGVVKKYDKSRPTTAGLAGVAMSNETEYPGALDIAGYNYTESRYILDHEKYPKRVLYGSENRHDLEAWKAVRDNEHIFGQFLWTGIDYLGESGRWPSRGFYSGLLDFGGFIKPRGYFRQSLWSDKPMAYLGTYPTPGRGSKSQMKDVWSQLDADNEGQNYEEKVPSMDAWPIWNYDEGQSIRVVCYTNAAKAKLVLNGNEVGKVKEYDDNTGIIYWDIPYRDGKLEVVGLDKNNNEISRYAIQSSKQPYALTITQSETEISKDKGLAQIVVQVVDENGIPVMFSDNEVTCQIQGPAKLLGLEASNNKDMSDYTDNKHRVFHGKILAYIQATGQQGEIKIRFTSPWLKAVNTTIIAK
ncbi:glycoside hydrolase family 2 protein [Dysgonomonas sp. HDW5A]|uniref:sugar-binding domain-containing protein n=1 Tax=Dysgonomonas sp. HDW5A TaxID=2714926 RepID=UPI00140B2E75|nr:sugar-binding domain-containing protein [Dysgonomonas sp. HDW5A]QIK59842.1 glycoside hydrolase family 2 protein [Dysgonomonas sp. HDW5A]